MLRKSDVRKEDISRVYDHVKDRFVLATNGYFALSLTTRQPYPLIFKTLEKGNKETKLYIGLGSYQSCDLNDQIVDITLLYLTYTVMALEKRFTEYQTMDKLFSDMEDDLMALMLWKRVLAYIEHILRVLGETLGVTLQHLIPTISGNDKELSKILVIAEALEKWDQVYGQSA